MDFVTSNERVHITNLLNLELEEATMIADNAPAYNPEVDASRRSVDDKSE